MNFLRNLMISKKMMLLFSIPFLGMIILAFLLVYENMSRSDSAKQSIRNIKSISLIGKAIHEVQKERGLSVGFATGSIDKSTLETQRITTDKTLAELHDASLTDLGDITALRSTVDSGATPPEIGKAYTESIGKSVENMHALTQEFSGELLAQSQNYMNLVRMKEIRGQTRAIVNGMVSKNTADKATLYKLAGMNAQFLALEKQFESNLPEEILSAYTKDVKSIPEREATLGMITTVLTQGEAGNFGIDPAIWFKTITQLIDGQHTTEQIYLEYLTAKTETLYSTLNAKTIQVLSLSFILSLLGVIVGYSIRNLILNSLSDLSEGITLLINKDDPTLRLEQSSSDEIGKIVSLFNAYMNKLQGISVKDTQAIRVIEETAEQIALGFVSVRVHTETGSAETKMAVDAINRMLESLEEALNTSSTILTSYARANYTANVEIGRYSGEIGGMLMALKVLGESTGDFMALVGKNGNALNSGAETLSMASENLSTAANQQASSLEETAAAIEELTSNISANSQKASEMATLARETEHAANSGKTLADSTVVSMNEISKATHAINEAVNIIENIAFQTNILSLNAAVEAATAGEAGKGFAVVAQEVRNLANRSADAASQIKELAELANSKSQDGLRVSEEMMKGFDVINQKITQTTQLVQDVANGSREQMAGINQINSAVAQLDQMTQQNAQSANSVNSLSNNILQMAQSLQDTASKTVYYPESENRVCRIDMMFDTTKLKLDHVLFKNNNFAKLKEQRVSVWTVTNESQCDLGKWIQAHSHESYAQGSAWNELLSYHAHVHQKVQEFVTMKASGKMSNASRKQLSLEIEHDTAKVFDALNKVRAEACRNEPIKEITKPMKKHSTHPQKNPIVLSAAKKPATQTPSSKNDTDVWESF